MVERKGIGHPDTICDALAEEICRSLCCAYLESVGAILHHNVDKILLCGGAARPAFGGGEIIEPIELYLGGRVTAEFDGRKIPVSEIGVEACREWLRRHVPDLDSERHIKIIPRFHPGSGALRSLFPKALGTAKATFPANDSSCGAGFAPLTPLERAVLEVEHTLNSAATKRSHPAIGSDIKIMGVRIGSRIHLTISCAFIGRHLANISDYVSAKDTVRELAIALAREIMNCDVDAVVNAADNIQQGNLFLTVTGTSAEAGDDGEVGRGNRVCGLITPYRQMTMEAAAGKNPVTHVGKLYNVAAEEISQRIVTGIPGIGSAMCLLVSQIGHSIEEPQMIDIRLQREPGADLGQATAMTREIVFEQLRRFDALKADLLKGRRVVY